MVYEDERTPVAIYIVKMETSGRDKTSEYFRSSLDGSLEKAVLFRGKDDETGHPIKGSGVKFDQDIDSPEVKKAFKTEMDYWLKDWLKKEEAASKRRSAGDKKDT
ncbi:MAG: hypothetical protein HYZ74_02940 [Elusimicrobia bacterium]|nr:hypothetical protein [Elusimicrobiota bacterium]